LTSPFFYVADGNYAREPRRLCQAESLCFD
jgi:hypothetical protein